MAETRTIVVADSNQQLVDQVAALLQAEGYIVLTADQGESLVNLVRKNDIAAIFFAHPMGPLSGFDAIRRLQGYGIDVPIVLMMEERTSDLLMHASKIGIHHFLQKPIAPERLIEMARRLVRDHKPVSSPGSSTNLYQATHTPQDLMARAIALADANAKSGRGGPFGAVVANAQGHILGEGVNGISARADPIAHAEVMAIRQATERLNQPHLEGCSLFVSSEPTAIGRALIQSVGLAHVYFGLSHDDIGQIRSKRDHKPANVSYQSMGRDAALSMYQNWQLQPEKKLD